MEARMRTRIEEHKNGAHVAAIYRDVSEKTPGKVTYVVVSRGKVTLCGTLSAARDMAKMILARGHMERMAAMTMDAVAARFAN